MKSEKKVVEDFLMLALDEYPIDQLALLSTWMRQSEDEVEYFANWCDLGDRVADQVSKYEIDLYDLLDDLMLAKQKRMNEAAEEERDRYMDMNGLR